jgi:hypothetical protein
MKNGVDHGREPYRAWIASWDQRKQIIVFANGGDPPAVDALRIPECAVRLEDDQHKVGLPLVKRFLRLEGGDIELLSRSDFGTKYVDCPDALRGCRTFYEVVFKEVT